MRVRVRARVRVREPEGVRGTVNKLGNMFVALALSSAELRRLIFFLSVLV